MIYTNKLPIENIKTQNIDIDSVKTQNFNIYELFREFIFFDGTALNSMSLKSDLSVSGNAIHITNNVIQTTSSANTYITLQNVDCDKIKKIIMNGSAQIIASPYGSGFLTVSVGSMEIARKYIGASETSHSETITFNENSTVIDLSTYSGINDINIVFGITRTGDKSNVSLGLSLTSIKGVE